LFDSVEHDNGQYEDTAPIFWASGAAMLVRADLYHEVGGLDADFFAHQEEIDLCWRLQNAGYELYVVPQSVVYHVGGGTLNKVSPQKTYLNFRNNLITLTKNSSRKFLFIKLFYRMILDGVAAYKFLFEGQPTHFWAVARAHFAYYGKLVTTLKKKKSISYTSKF
jgi:GT2 family glycosyltransferase